MSDFEASINRSLSVQTSVAKQAEVFKLAPENVVAQDALLANVRL